MQIDKKAVEELQQILVEEYSESLSFEETEVIGKNLINLYETVLINKNKNAIKKPQSLHWLKTNR